VLPRRPDGATLLHLLRLENRIRPSLLRLLILIIQLKISLIHAFWRNEPNFALSFQILGFWPRPMDSALRAVTPFPASSDRRGNIFGDAGSLGKQDTR
jgi:hypothetical protein